MVAWARNNCSWKCKRYSTVLLFFSHQDWTSDSRRADISFYTCTGSLIITFLADLWAGSNCIRSETPLEICLEQEGVPSYF